jgi:membrane dipeptidase
MRRIPVLCFIIAVGCLALVGDPPRGADKSERAPPAALAITPEAATLHRSLLLIDGHNDLPWKVRTDFQGDWRRVDISQLQPKLQTDIPKLKAGGVGAQFWSAYVPANTDKLGTALRDTLDQIDLIHDMVRRWPDTFEMALTADDIVRIHQQGKIASLIGVEGGHSIQNSLGALRQLYRLGVRYMTLTHSDSLDWADSATDDPRSGGLSEFGRDVVREMNRLGMLVDLSHVSPETMRAALAATQAPVIFSHSSAKAVADHPRNVPDDILQLVKQNGGVVMINFYSGFVVPESAANRREMFHVRRKFRAELPNEAAVDAAMDRWHAEHPIEAGTLKIVVDHIDHIAKLIGPEYVGIGSDFDGVALTPVGLENVSTYPFITQELLNRGYSAEQIRNISGENILRVMRQAEATARRLQELRS